ncbi:hypothetical protein Tco_1193822, partial [Tanacetum coccineum]
MVQRQQDGRKASIGRFRRTSGSLQGKPKSARQDYKRILARGTLTPHKVKIAAYENYVALYEQEAGGLSSGPKRRRTYIPRERETAQQRLMDDYFDDEEFEPKYPEENFRR